MMDSLGCYPNVLSGLAVSSQCLGLSYYVWGSHILPPSGRESIHRVFFTGRGLQRYVHLGRLQHLA
jgi:hypothetical protein